MSYSTNNTHFMRPFNENGHSRLTYDQRTMINNYLNMYNNTINEIRILNTFMTELRTNIDYIYFQSESANHNIDIGTNSNNSNRLRNTQYRRNSIPYLDIRRSRRNITYRQNVNETFLDPVPIIPTTSQIVEATTILRFGNIQNPVNIICPITRDPFEVSEIVTQIKYCSHVFNSSALNTWFLSNCICPVCRYDIRDFLIYLATESQTSTNTQTEPITTTVSSIPQSTQHFRFRDIINNDSSTQHYARENAAELETNLLRNYINASNLDVSNNLIIFEAVVTNNRNQNRNRRRNRFT